MNIKRISARSELLRTVNYVMRNNFFARVAIAAICSISNVGLAATIDATFNAPSDVPITTNSYTASSNTVNFTLNFTPTTGTELTVVKNTGLNFINGTFDNLAQGQSVMLVFGGIGHRFVANYFGGSGNDLVLVWASNRVFAWGMSLYGQLGTTPTNTSYPQPVTATGVMSGKTVLAVAAGSMHSLALCSDGSLAAWGYNNYGQLGDNSQTDRHEPVLVNASASSALFGKTVIALAAGGEHSLALCSDGTVATWGNNGAGQLGDNTTTRRLIPVAVNTASGVSALYEKTVIAITAGQYHSAALCSDGTAVAWGANAYGEVGDNTSGTNRLAPTAVNTTAGISALFDKTVVAIECGQRFTLALCSDGTVAGWGNNGYSQLGNTNANRLAPGQVNTNSGTSILFGKSIVAIAAGDYHGLALCSDGVLTAWGQNDYRQLGDNSSTIRWFPVAVNMAPGISALHGKTVTGISAGYYHSLAVCSDGTAAGWGYSPHGQIGDGNIGAFRNVPAAVSTNTLVPGERFLRTVSGPYSFHTLGIVASPSVTAPEINAVGNSVAIQNGDTTPDAADHTDFGSAVVGGSVVRTFTIENSGTSPLNLTGAPKVSVSGAHAADFTVTQQPTSPIAISSNATFQVTFAPSAGFSRHATLTISNDDADENPFRFDIRGFGFGPGELDASYTNGTEVPLVASQFTATSNTVRFKLNYAPTPGTELMVVQNTGLRFIVGTFDNLAQGQLVTLVFNGIGYRFVANYYGGSGNDLVLVWADQRAFACGLNAYTELGDGTATSRLLPVPVTATGVLAGKTVLAVSAGEQHSLALCSDGTLAAWGNNSNGKLGDNSTTPRAVPVAVSVGVSSALYGKRVITIAAGSGHSLALCSDGTVAAWGGNSSGQLGDNSATPRFVPVSVNATSPASALFGKTVVFIAAGGNHSLALCSDGTVAAWGYNANGQLGDDTSGTNRDLPIAVNTNSALFGKSVVAIAAGQNHSLALCSDGTVAAWGQNNYGQIGDNTSGANLLSPVAVNTASGVSALFGKSVIAVEAGTQHSLALCSDGSIAGWGRNDYGELGDRTVTAIRKAPVLVNTEQAYSALYSKVVTRIGSGDQHSLAVCSDGTAAAWGYNPNGQLGDNTSTLYRTAPVAMSTTAMPADAKIVRVSDGPVSYHTLVLVAAPVVAAPKISVVGNGLTIPNNDTTPGGADHTDFGSAAVAGGTVVRTFTIENLGTAALNLTGTPKVSITGAHAADFTVSQQPISPVAVTSNTTIQVTFAPSGPFTRYATVTIANDDSGANPYTFAIRGIGLGPGEMNAVYSDGTEIAFVTSDFTPGSNSVHFTLNYAPTPGTELMVVQSTGLNFINGSFNNLTNGQPVSLSYGGITYDFVANYFGGSGNDLVLVWARNRAFAWGNNWLGAVGDGTNLNRSLPVPVTATGVLAGKTLVDLAAGRDHNVVLCSDGTVAAWGWNADGQLGDGTTADKYVPVLVNTGTNSALYGKRVVAVAAGNKHSLALCSDGTIAAWGFNGDCTLGDGTTTDRSIPVAVDAGTNSALFGKTVIAISAGRFQSVALCSDGTVANWGLNDDGQLGNGSTTNSTVPVVVNTGTNSALFGKMVVAVSSGLAHTLALCSDGTVAGWGQNTSAQLGEGFAATAYALPVATKMDTSASALYGRKVSAIVAGRRHSAALCDDGIVATWGDSSFGALGTNSNGLVPKAVSRQQGSSALYDKTVTSITAGYGNTLALCSDDALTAWGLNDSGQIGNSSTTNCYLPVMVNSTPLAVGERFIRLYKGSMAYHTLALVASPLPPLKLEVIPWGTGTLKLQWPANYIGANLQANADLANPGGWTNVNETAVLRDGKISLTLPTDDAARFFRLRWP